MTEQRCSTDAYARACDATVVSAGEQADGGTHVRSTAEVCRVRVATTESKGGGFKRMRIQLLER